jgi:hypothetical protein
MMQENRAMRERTQQEINEIGFRALVGALGREDAIRFVEQFSERKPAEKAKASEEQHLPPFSPEEAHELIRSMQEPPGQASFL